MNSEYPASDMEKPYDLSCISHSFQMKWALPFDKIKTNIESKNQILCMNCKCVKYSHNEDCKNCHKKGAGTEFRYGVPPDLNASSFGCHPFQTSGIFASNQKTKQYVPSISITVIEKSLLFDFKDLKIYPFHLELFREDNGDNSTFGIGLKTKGPSNITLEHAVVSANNRLFCLKVANKIAPTHLKERLLTSGILKSISPEPETITIVCRVRGTSDVHSSSTPAWNKADGMDSEQRMVFECLFPTKEPSPVATDWQTSVSSNPTEAIAKYLGSGELPSLNVELAKQLVGDQQCPDELKAWCVEYLMVNLDPDNVVGILKTAADHFVKDLLTCCTDYLTTQCEVKKK